MDISEAFSHLCLLDAGGVNNWPTTTLSGEITKLNSSSPTAQIRAANAWTQHGPAEWDELGRLFPQPVFWQFFPGENTAFSSSSFPSQPGENVLDRPHQNALVFERCPKLVTKLNDETYMWVDKSLLLKVVTGLPRAMNANITELMEFPCEIVLKSLRIWGNWNCLKFQRWAAK